MEFFQSTKFKWIMAGIATAIVLLVVFQLGVFIGFRKANYSYQWGDNYNRMFGAAGGGFLRGLEGRDFTSGHGIAGTVVKIDGNNLVVTGQDGREKIITVGDDTVFKKGPTDIKLADLKVGDQAVIIGSPQNDASVTAEIVRIFDPSTMPLPLRVMQPLNK
jgi:hypothetical protein